MKICIFGCTGYLGSELSCHLSNSGHQVIGVCRKFPKKEIEFKKNFAKVYEGDINSRLFLKKIFSSKPQVIIYLISLNHFDSEKNLDNSLKINCLPVIRILDFIREKNLNMKFIYFSTMQVYGDYANKKLITENTNKNPKNTYALTHSICEDYLLMMNKYKNFSSTCIRLSNGYGFPRLKSCDCWWLVLNDFCLNSYKNSRINISSDGSPLRDFIHITDISRTVNHLIKAKSIPSLINLASGKAVSMLELAKYVSDVNAKLNNNISIYIKGKRINKKSLTKKINMAKSIRKFKFSTKLLDDFKIKKEFDLNSGIENTIKSMKKINL